MELRNYLSIVSTYRWYLILIPLVAALVGLGATYAVSPRFQGQVTVQIIPEQTESSAVSLRTDDGASVPAIGLQNPTELLAQGFIEMLGSREVAELVVQRLKLDAAPEPQGIDALRAWVNDQIANVWAFVRYGYVHQNAGTDRAIERVQAALSASLVRGSYFMHITGTWRDPDTASSLANAGVDALIVHSRRVAATAAAEQRQFLESQVADSRARVDQARSDLLNSSSSTNTVSGESVKLAVAALDAARTAQRQAGAQLAEAEQRLAVVQQQLPETAEQSESVQSTTSSTGTSASPTPTEARSTTTTMRSTSAPNTVYLALQDRQNELQQEVAALQNRMARTPLTGQNDSALADARHQLSIAEQQLSSTPPEVQTTQQTQANGDTTNTTRTNTSNTADNAITSTTAHTPSTLNSTSTGNGTTASKENSSSTARTSAPNPVYVTLQERVNTLKQQVAGLEGRQSDADAQRQQNQSALDDARRRLDIVNQQLADTSPESAITETTSSVVQPAAAPSSTSSATSSTTQRTSGPNPVFVSLQDRQNQVQAEIAGLQARQSQADQDVNQRQDDVRTLVVNDSKLTQLNQELSLANDAYAQRSAAWSRAVVEEARPVTQLRVIDPSTQPAYPAWPIKILWAGIGGAAGLLAALVLVFVLYSVDLTLRTPAAAEEAFGDLRLLAVVPSRGNGHHHRSLGPALAASRNGGRR
jgi:uncharacterized protein involved in exopolysaccharide biosynthesis